MSAVLKAPDMGQLEQSRAKMAAAPSWPPLDPLPEAAVAEPEPFPFDGLGPLLGEAARAIAHDVQAPDALAGGSVLAAAALAVQAHADIELPHGDLAPLSLFVVGGALSGDRKSATDKVACKPIEDARREQARDHARALEAHAAEKVTAKKGEAVDPPPQARSLTIGKGTTEGLHTMLKGQSHVGLFSSEGGELLGGHSLRDDRRAAGLSWMLKAWGGETLDDLTRGAGLSLLPGRRVSMHVMVQPVLLRQLLADPLAAGQGLLARCLIAEPASIAGTRMFNGTKPAENATVRRYHTAMARLLALPPRVHPDGDGFELEPRRLCMSTEASALWVAFYDAVEAQQALGQPLSGAKAFASKAAEHAARIAGVVEMFSDCNAVAVQVGTMAGALQVVEFYLNEHLRLTGASMEHQRLDLLHKLLDWMLEQPGAVKAADLLQRAPRPIRAQKADGIKRLTDELERRGYIRALANGWEVRHGLRT